MYAKYKAKLDQLITRLEKVIKNSRVGNAGKSFHELGSILKEANDGTLFLEDLQKAIYDMAERNNFVDHQEDLCIELDGRLVGYCSPGARIVWKSPEGAGEGEGK